MQGSTSILRFNFSAKIRHYANTRTVMGKVKKQQPNLNMESKELNKLAEVEHQVETLETEVKKFANGLRYWAKYIAEKI